MRMLRFRGLRECLIIISSSLNSEAKIYISPYLRLSFSQRQLPVSNKLLLQFANLLEVSHFLLILKGIVTNHFSLHSI